MIKISDSETKILLIDKDPAFARYLRELLVVSEKKGELWQINHVMNFEEAVYLMESEHVHIIVLGLNNLDRYSLELLTRLNAKYPMIPIVVLTTLDDQKAGVESVRHGAQDYLIKDQLTVKLFKKTLRYAITRKNLERVKDEFVSYVTHELCTPLTVIREGISQVEEGILGEINEQQRIYLNTSLGNIDRLGHIVEELLDVAKIEFRKIRLEYEEFNLVQLVNEIISTYEPVIKKKDLSLQKSFSSDDIRVYADRDRITQVIVNLISNAIKYTQEGYIEVKVNHNKHTAYCSVADTGLGIPEKELPKVFHKFEQVEHHSRLKEKGTGLGLAICKGLVEVHRGNIWVESKVDEGTKFTFSLPLLDEAVLSL